MHDVTTALFPALPFLLHLIEASLGLRLVVGREGCGPWSSGVEKRWAEGGSEFVVRVCGVCGWMYEIG